MSSAAVIALWLVSALAVAGMLARPWRVPEWVWASGGAMVLVATGVLPLGDALRGIGRGADVYAFLIGILALAEFARAARLFDWLAVRLLHASGASPSRLLGLVYLAGVAVTVVLSNDTTVVVLTPAVLAALKRSDADPLPYLYACAFVANAASFVLPISNPANLVVFGSALPALRPWFAAFGLASLAAVVLTYAVLRGLMHRRLARPLSVRPLPVDLPPGAGVAATVLAASILALVAATWLGVNVGYTALGAALVTGAVLAVASRDLVRRALPRVSWHVVPLVAGLFAIVTALDRAGGVAAGRELLSAGRGLAAPWGTLVVGAVVTAVVNVFNNLPVGVLAGFALQSAHALPALAHATLVAIDLGPNVSVTGSLATLLWLFVLRRDGIHITAWQFARLGIAVTLPALIAALLLVR